MIGEKGALPVPSLLPPQPPFEPADISVHPVLFVLPAYLMSNGREAAGQRFPLLIGQGYRFIKPTIEKSSRDSSLFSFPGVKPQAIFEPAGSEELPLAKLHIPWSSSSLSISPREVESRSTSSSTCASVMM